MHAWKAAWKESRVGTSGQHWDRLANSGSSSRTGFPQSLIKIPRSISPARLIPASPRKTTSQLLPTRKAPAGRSVLAIINEAVPNLGGLASVPSRRCVIILAVGSLIMNAHVCIPELKIVLRKRPAGIRTRSGPRHERGKRRSRVAWWLEGELSKLARQSPFVLQESEGIVSNQRIR